MRHYTKAIIYLKISTLLFLITLCPACGNKKSNTNDREERGLGKSRQNDLKELGLAAESLPHEFFLYALTLLTDQELSVLFKVSDIRLSSYERMEDVFYWAFVSSIRSGYLEKSEAWHEKIDKEIIERSLQRTDNMIAKRDNTNLKNFYINKVKVEMDIDTVLQHKPNVISIGPAFWRLILDFEDPKYDDNWFAVKMQEAFKHELNYPFSYIEEKERKEINEEIMNNLFVNE